MVTRIKQWLPAVDSCLERAPTDFCLRAKCSGTLERAPLLAALTLQKVQLRVGRTAATEGNSLLELGACRG